MWVEVDDGHSLARLETHGERKTKQADPANVRPAVLGRVLG